MLGYAQIAKLNALSLSRVFSIKLCQGDTLLALGKPLGIAWKFTRGRVFLTVAELVSKRHFYEIPRSHESHGVHGIVCIYSLTLTPAMLRKPSNTVSVGSGSQAVAENFLPVI